MTRAASFESGAVLRNARADVKQEKKKMRYLAETKLFLLTRELFEPGEIFSLRTLKAVAPHLSSTCSRIHIAPEKNKTGLATEH